MRTVPVLSILWYSLLGAVSQCEHSTVTENRLFSCQLIASDYFQDVDLLDGVPVDFKASVVGHVGLPSWLSLYQFSSDSPVAYLYGTPPFSSSQVASTLTIMIQTQRKDTFESSVRTIDLTIEPAQNGSVSIAQLYITNQNIDDFLVPTNLQIFEDILRVVLDSSESWILTVSAPTSIGVLIPPPPSKHGVVVRVTAGVDATIILATDEESQSVQENCNSAVTKPPKNFDLFEQTGFSIDWCQYQVGELASVMRLAVEGEGREEGGREGVEIPDESMESVPLVIVVVICVLVLVVLVVGISCLMFGGRRQSLTGKQSVRMTVLRMTQEEGRQQAAVQVALRDLATLPHKTVGEIPWDSSVEGMDVADLQGPTPPPPYQYPPELL